MIHGINDPNSLKKTPPRVDFKLYKGSKKVTKVNRSGKKYQIFGTDLNDRFRLETKEEYLIRILQKKHPISEQNGNICLRHLTVLIAYNKIEDTFNCAMELYNSSGLLHKCDRQHIYLRMEEYIDPFGHKRKKAVSDGTPCPVANTLEDCPHKCNKAGHLYFYVPELLEAGLNRLGCLSVHSYSDLIGISQKLQSYEEQFGSIKTSPFPSPQTFNLIPYKLSRTEIDIKRPVIDDRKRTGKKSASTTWAVQLEVLPDWLIQWQNWQRLNELKQLGYYPSPKLIEQVYDLNSSQLLKDTTTDKLLPSSNNIRHRNFEENVITPEQSLELKELLIKSHWTPQQFLSALAALGKEKVADLTVQEFEQIKSVIA